MTTDDDDCDCIYYMCVDILEIELQADAAWSDNQGEHVTHPICPKQDIMGLMVGASIIPVASAHRIIVHDHAIQ